MTCAEVRPQLLSAARGRLDREADAAIAEHLERCEACAQAKASERALDEALARTLPRSAAPASLKRRLALMAGPAPQRVDAPPRARLAFLARPLGVAAALALVLGAALWWQGRPSSSSDALAAELVNDHLRVLVRERPVDVESHGAHEVKPWFEGKLDFAPDVPSPTIPDLQLRGGVVGYVFDQKAALVLYTLRRHAVTFVVRRADGPVSGRGGVRLQSIRGFHVASWQTGGLSYAVVSDVNRDELDALARRFAAETDPNGTR